VKFTAFNSIAIDGTIGIARDNRIVWTVDLPAWLITVYCWVACR
jgi:hypothetical protein